MRAELTPAKEERMTNPDVCAVPRSQEVAAASPGEVWLVRAVPAASTDRGRLLP